MIAPESALAHARAAAASMRASGAYGEDAAGIEPGRGDRVRIERLPEWALIEPDVDEVRSTRALGAPMTALKRALLRLLGQYNAQLVANQTRFNAHVLGHIRVLENRIEELERAAAEREQLPR